MFVKQIDMAKALELAAKGMEIKVLAPIGQEDGWENLAPDTLQHMLEGVMFFRQEPALEKEILPAVSGARAASRKVPVGSHEGIETGQTAKREAGCGHREDEGPAGGRMELCEDRG